MTIQRNAIAGTLESSDIMVRMYPAEEGRGIDINLQSAVKQQYGSRIIEVITQMSRELGITDLFIEAVDKGALDCTIRARVETAIRRGC